MGTVTGYVNPPIPSSLLHQAHLFGLRQARSRLRSGNTAAHRDVVEAHPLGGPARRRHGIKHFLQNPTDRSLIRVHRRFVVGRVPAGTASGLVDFTALHLVGPGARRSVHARAHSEVG